MFIPQKVSNFILKVTETKAKVKDVSLIPNKKQHTITINYVQAKKHKTFVYDLSYYSLLWDIN